MGNLVGANGSTSNSVFPGNTAEKRKVGTGEKRIGKKVTLENETNLVWFVTKECARGGVGKGKAGLESREL